MRWETKTFIETNIELIEDRDWLTLFQGWYDVAYGSIETEEARFEDLNYTLYEAGVCSYSETDKVRKQIIYKEVEEIIQHWIDDIGNWAGSSGWIGMYYIINGCLRSHLGLSTSTIRDIVKDVAISKDLIPDKHDEGFKMRRFI